jgi:hypothetical protein
MEENRVVKNELQKVAVVDRPIVIALPDKPETSPRPTRARTVRKISGRWPSSITWLR